MRGGALNPSSTVQDLSRRPWFQFCLQGERRRARACTRVHAHLPTVILVHSLGIAIARVGIPPFSAKKHLSQNGYGNLKRSFVYGTQYTFFVVVNIVIQCNGYQYEVFCFLFFFFIMLVFTFCYVDVFCFWLRVGMFVCLFVCSFFSLSHSNMLRAARLLLTAASLKPRSSIFVIIFTITGRKSSGRSCRAFHCATYSSQIASSLPA